MAPVLQIGRMSVPSEVDAEWNAWYNNEYIPGYRKVPGVIYARRYRVHEGTSGYTTVYEFASTAVPESAEWKEQQQHSSPHSPRMRQAMTHAPGSAGVYTRIDPSKAPRGRAPASPLRGQAHMGFWPWDSPSGMHVHRHVATRSLNT